MQAEVAGIWEQINTDNLKTLADFEGYRQEFLQLFGFGVDGLDYDADVDPKSRSLSWWKDAAPRRSPVIVGAGTPHCGAKSRAYDWARHEHLCCG